MPKRKYQYISFSHLTEYHDYSLRPQKAHIAHFKWRYSSHKQSVLKKTAGHIPNHDVRESGLYLVLNRSVESMLLICSCWSHSWRQDPSSGRSTLGHSHVSVHRPRKASARAAAPSLSRPRSQNHRQKQATNEHGRDLGSNIFKLPNGWTSVCLWCRQSTLVWQLVRKLNHIHKGLKIQVV